MRRLYLGTLIMITTLLMSPTAFGHQKGWPGKRLSQTYPEAVKFTSRQAGLSAEQIGRIEQALGERIEAESRAPTFYLAFNKAGEKIGFVLFADQAGESGPIEMGVAVDPQGKVRHVAVFSSREDKKISRPSFLDQFNGKSVKDPLKVGEDITPVAGSEKGSQAVANGVRKALMIKREVFGGQIP
jgi:Na+-translocating ferredoxin:NAD+ oxidoreductase RnfG subunit